MRFTKIPLIATLMAVALSLLIVLPGIAQTGDLTDGKQSSGVVDVGVFDDITDAQMAKLTNSASDVAGVDSIDSGVFIPRDTPVRQHGTEAVHSSGDLAYLAENTVSPQDTFFKNTLYVSNDGNAYNTVLINVRSDETATCDTTDGTVANVMATVRNNRAGGDPITLELALSSTAGNFQAFFKVVEDGDEGTLVDATGTAVAGEDPVPFTEHGGPTWCADTSTYDHDDDTTTTEIQRESTAATAGYNPVQQDPNANPPTRGEIATIFADHGDRLTITTNAGSGQIELVVDGEGPEFTAVTPDDNAVLEARDVTFSFEVRDDDSGLRHDGESVISPDGDYDEINPDGDHNLGSEPLSVDPETAVNSNGESADIDVNVAPNPRSKTETPTDPEWDDISASGTWRMAGNRAGVAYAFTAGAHRNDDASYLYQIEATDRAGNKNATDAESDTDNVDEPYVFRVDNTDPDLIDARTGITWDSDKDTEVVDRSYVALTFNDGADGGGDPLGDVDTDNITVVGYTIVGFIHPSERPAIDRNLGIPKRANFSPTNIRYTPAEPSGTRPSLVEPTNDNAYTAALAVTPDSDRTTAQNNLLLLEGRFVHYAIIDAQPDEANGDSPEPAEPTSTEPDCDDLGELTAANVELCGQWDQHEIDKAAYDAAEDAKEAADEEHQAAVDAYNAAPGKDIVGGDIADPRSRVYVELSEDLPADAEPDVVVIGGAVHDLADNTNDAKTVDSEDWIAPSLTVTVTGTANDRPVINGDGSFSIDVRSDEDLARRPVVFFVSIAATQTEGEDTETTNDDEYEYAIDMRDEASALTQAEDENHWTKKYKRSSIDDSVGTGLIGIVVLGKDSEDNSGATTGWSPDMHRNAGNPAADDELTLSKMDDAGLLVEIDEEFNADVDEDLGEVTPRSDDKATTESANPFVKLTFGNEGKEYSLDGFSGADSHKTVTVTEITLNGDDVMAHLNRVSSTEFSLVLRDLAVDSYEVVFTAEDDAGNELEDGEFDFKVNPREPYEIDVQPGWNLVSLPATPVDSGIADVLANNQYISPVLGYQEGDWITAIREEDGTWRGRLTEIVGGYGYWVHARTFESIETMLSEVDPAGILPTVPVTAGWNLLGVLDIFQNDAGDPPGEESANGFAAANYEADNYFSSIDWKVAYTYDTTQSLWVKTVPEATSDGANEIKNGNGYWVWSPSPSTLVP